MTQLTLIRRWYAGENGEHAYELYDLANDIGERNNLASAKPTRVDQLSAQLDRWLIAARAPLPIINPEWNGRAASRGRRRQ